MTQKDVGQRQNRHFYFKNGTLDFLAGWLLGLSQQGGLSPGELFHVFNHMQGETPDAWVNAFTNMHLYVQHEAVKCQASGDLGGAGARYMAATVAARATLHQLDPTTARARAMTHATETAFQQALKHLNIPLEAWDIPFQGKHLPAYVSTELKTAPLLFVVVGGGDTYREDLWFFGGKAALEHGYAVLLADLPGQGATPDQGLHFGPATLEALETALHAVRARGFSGQVVLCGWSGGGFFTTKFVSDQPEHNPHRLAAWIASTPVHDVGRFLTLALPATLRRNPHGSWQQRLIQLARRLNPSLNTTIRKYEWQFGGPLADVLAEYIQLGQADLNSLRLPLLGFLGGSEFGAEGRQQAWAVYNAVKPHFPQSELITFPPESGADAHCQVNNFPLAFHHIFRWLDELGLTPQAC